MKLILLIILIIFGFQSSAWGQEPTLSIEAKQEPIQEIMKKIEHQTGMTFSYDPSILKGISRITFKSDNQSISECLTRLFQKLPLSYQINGTHIILKKRPRSVTISGFVRDKATTEYLIGASVYDSRTQRGTATNNHGFFGSPDKSGGKFFNSIENLHLCTMNNQGLLALAQLILPSEILSNFEVVRVEEEASLIRIYLDESVKAEYKENPEIESKGFCEAVTIRDFPIRDKGVDLIVRRRKWYDKQNNRYFSDSYDLKAEETRYSKEFAAFLKGVYGDDSYDLPFA